MFFRHYWFYVLGLLPVRKRVSRYLRVVLGYYDCRDKLVTWHRAELERMDEGFHFQQAGLRLVDAREKALAEGIGPMDPRYPSIFDFHPLPKIDFEKIKKREMEKLQKRPRFIP